jgi:hypothetical protein
VSNSDEFQLSRNKKIKPTKCFHKNFLGTNNRKKKKFFFVKAEKTKFDLENVTNLGKTWEVFQLYGCMRLET